MRPRARLEPLPGARCLRLEHARQDLGEGAGYAVTTRVRASRHLARRARTARAARRRPTRTRREAHLPAAAPRVFRFASSRSTLRRARARTNEPASTSASPESSPRDRSHSASSSGVAMSSTAQTAISVFTKPWTRSSGGGAGARPAGWKPGGTTTTRSVLPVSTTPSRVVRRFQRLTPCTGLPAASHA